jgi:hypothetical protein
MRLSPEGLLKLCFPRASKSDNRRGGGRKRELRV